MTRLEMIQALHDTLQTFPKDQESCKLAVQAVTGVLSGVYVASAGIRDVKDTYFDEITNVVIDAIHNWNHQRQIKEISKDN